MGSAFTIPGMSPEHGRLVAHLLQKQLSTYNDLHLTLKHVHWNVAGLNFIGVHEMIDHLAALDLVYDGVISDIRNAIAKTEQPDPVTQDMLIEQSAALEKFQWFVRAHLENAGGALVQDGSSTEQGAARGKRS